MDYDEFTSDFDIRQYSFKLQLYLIEKKKIENKIEYKRELINKIIKSENEEKVTLKQQNNLNKKIGPGIYENVRLKIVDLGNACLINHNFSTEIQTRQYRSPEI